MENVASTIRHKFGELIFAKPGANNEPSKVSNVAPSSAPAVFHSLSLSMVLSVVPSIVLAAGFFWRQAHSAVCSPKWSLL